MPTIPTIRERISNLASVTVPKLRSAIKKKPPGLGVERELWDAGSAVVVGVDEVGRGSWAGPISVGAAVVPSGRRVYKIRDSKMLTEDEREALFDRITEWLEDWSVGHASHTECDELGMSAAQRLAARRAIEGLSVFPDHVLVDGNWDFVGHPQTTRIVRGDATSLTIAAASIIAKVTRDRMMRAIAGQYPWFNFENNKGYPGPHHRAALAAFGPTTIHRRSWVFVDHLVWNGIHRIEPFGQTQLFETAAS